MMSELDNNCKEIVIDLKKIDIFAKYVLAKSEFKNTQILFQEAYNENAVGTGEKLPLRLLIINHNSIPASVPDRGAGVRCIKLYKRQIAEGYPVNTICAGKSRVTIRYQLILVVEYEDGFVDILTLPNNLSNPLQYDPLITKAFVDSTVISPSGVPVIQRQNVTVPNETLIIVSNGVNDYPWFDYNISIPFSYFEKYSRHINLNCCQDLESFVLLKCLNSDINIMDSQLVALNAENTLFVWTTEVALSVYEDIIDKLGMDSDIIICGSPEYECEKDCPKTCDCP